MYKTGTANNLKDLLDVIKINSVNLGYSIGERTNEVYLKKDKAIISIATSRENYNNQSLSGDGPRLQLALLDNYEINKPRSGQIYGKEINADFLFYPFVKWHLFADNDYMHFIVEISNGLFSHFGWGKINDIWYLTAQPQYHVGVKGGLSTFSRVATKILTSKVKNLSVSAYESLSSLGGDDRNFSLYSLLNNSPNSSNGISPLIPLFLFTRRDDNGSHTFHGQVKDVRALRIDNYIDGESLFLGNDEWIVFPVRVKKYPEEKTNPSDFNSGLSGIAYRKTI